MFVVHVAMQGCLRGRNVAYGITADTGGHIRYLLGLVDALAQDAAIGRIVVATRAFVSEFGADYARAREIVSPKVEIVRFATPEPGYLAKEELWHQTPSFAEALIAWIGEQPRPPDFLHAHYADAGAVAAQVHGRLGIPFVFTAHSLGRPKRRAFAAGHATPPMGANLDRRVAAEERALAQAAVIIASSRDEAEIQYAEYAGYAPGRIRVLPPGSDLSLFASATPSAEVDGAIGRFLNRPDKPVLLAIARPVAKKNLAGLLKAYGECPELQEMANLVIIAGTRRDIDDLEPELADNLREILHLIDLYDLYGKVAYPKSHRPEDLPGIYMHARARRGIFVNPALNEPFGLTLLEAAAAGLPVIATDSGGPNDIIEQCRNGELVSPHSPRAIAAAALRILSDDAMWDRYSAAGAAALRAYDWQAHATRYARLLRALRTGQPPRTSQPAQLLVCDIDNTLIGDTGCVRDFAAWYRAQTGLAFGIATGRSFHSALAILELEHAPLPDVMITSVGSEIYRLHGDGVTYVEDRDWQSILAAGWQRDAIVRALEGEPRIRLQSPLEQRRFKLSYLTDGGRDLVDRLRDRLDEAGLDCSIIHSHGRYLDILPASASKGTAVEHVRRSYRLGRDRVFVAGDSGNDVEMLRAIPQAIIVGNFSDDLASRPGLGHSYVARGRYARGVIEGVDHFRRLQLARQGRMGEGEPEVRRDHTAS